MAEKYRFNITFGDMLAIMAMVKGAISQEEAWEMMARAALFDARAEPLEKMGEMMEAFTAAYIKAMEELGKAAEEQSAEAKLRGLFAKILEESDD